jgi:Glycosyl hydrolases family 39
MSRPLPRIALPTLLLTLLFVSTVLIAAEPTSLVAKAAETVTVDLGADGGEILHRASGFLHGFSHDGQLPPDNMIVPLKARLHRTRPGTTWAQAERMKKLGIEQQLVISDGWGYGKEHPGDDGKWVKWEEFVVRIVQDAQKRGLKPQWDIWNEPDHHFFWQRSPEQFNETWRRAYLKIRQADPQAIIIGPSWSNVHPGQPRFAEFIRFCKENKVVPDYVCWHFPRDVLKEAEECRKLLKAENIQVKGLMINEYCTPNEQYAGKTAWLIAQIERAKIDLSCHAIWSDEGKGNLDGILFDARQAIPKGQWWAYQRYAALSGGLASSTPSTKIDLVASRDEQGRIVHVLLGNKGGLRGDVKVSFHGLDKAAYLREGDRIQVVVERIPEDKGGAVIAVQTVIDTRLPIYDSTLDVTIPWTSDRDAFAVRLGPNQR